MSSFDAVASQSAYADHLAPLWRALEPEERGRFHAWGQTATHCRERLGLKTTPGLPAARGGWLLCASQGDARRRPARRVALLEHGAGQAYDVPHGAYSGGPGRDNCSLFLCPNEVVAQRNRAAYPDALVEVVGSPRLDALIAKAQGDGSAVPMPAVALSFHWACGYSTEVPEAGMALEHFRSALPGLARSRELVGHGHPRYRGHFAALWRELRIPDVPWFEDLLERAWLYVCDNSSTLYEWAALGRPVVVLNSPAYRRDLEAWPRFWACADVGVQCDEPGELPAAIERALEDSPAVAERRRQVVEEVFPLRGGSAARAVHALREAADALR